MPLLFLFVPPVVRQHFFSFFWHVLWLKSFSLKLKLTKWDERREVGERISTQRSVRSLFCLVVSQRKRKTTTLFFFFKKINNMQGKLECSRGRKSFRLNHAISDNRKCSAQRTTRSTNEFLPYILFIFVKSFQAFQKPICGMQLPVSWGFFCVCMCVQTELVYFPKSKWVKIVQQIGCLLLFYTRPNQIRTKV